MHYGKTSIFRFSAARGLGDMADRKPFRRKIFQFPGRRLRWSHRSRPAASWHAAGPARAKPKLIEQAWKAKPGIFDV
jgi:hypothetical protein